MRGAQAVSGASGASGVSERRGVSASVSRGS